MLVNSRGKKFYSVLDQRNLLGIPRVFESRLQLNEVIITVARYFPLAAGSQDRLCALNMKRFVHRVPPARISM